MNRSIFELNFNLNEYYKTSNPNIKLEKEDIEFNKRGVHIADHTWNGSLDNAAKIVKEIVKDNLDWTTIKTMYRYPDLSLSRDKLSLMKEKYGTRIVRDRDKADVCVISEKGVHKLISSDMYYGSTWDVKTFIDKKLPELSYVLSDEAYSYLADILSNLQDDWLIFCGNRYHSWNCSDAFEKSNLTYFTDSLELSDKTKVHIGDGSRVKGSLYIKNENLDKYKALHDPSKLFVSDVYVNQVCSEDSIALDWEQYESIKKMLSATREDVSVAMTLMANCKIEESKTALGLLFYHYGDHMKGTKVWNQVAFKTLRKQFDHYMISGWNASHTSTFSSLIQKLAADDALTEEAMKHVCELVFERVLMSGCGFNTDQCAFEMKLEDVRLTPEYKEKLKKEEKTLSELVTMGDGLPF